jgi:hypothetical protein
MRITKELYLKLIDKPIKVICTDGEIFEGIWIDRTSELDNEPDGASITIRTSNSPYMEFYDDEIANIEASESFVSVSIPSMSESRKTA